ncbi:MAG: Holliday junction resolvase RuvX [Clostridia bacterium]|nr:Holliday junction resolvase RuvX [Clostridia bacterium]MBQ3471987.1 Holliday junction resolvase RuvX [Clostridia bacterium]MBR0090040.1 Holliday junction resolvase RuvX [Clostridia bacterium]MBR0470180.1 Holliday junction resolvase RuvX [Clostridia bacterium]
MRTLGIDYGDARVGVAVSDLLGITAQGVKTIKNTGIKKLLAELKEVIDEYKPEKIIIGLPKNMDGSEGFRAQATREFAKRLEEIYDGKIIFWDERLSSMGAKRYLNETNTRGKKRKEVLDTVAACIILEGYLTANPF